MRHFRHIALACGALMASTATLPAAGLDQQLIVVDVLDGGMAENGTYQAALRLRLADGWKTYWRAPGDAGIPPIFHWRGSRNVGDVTISWPAPEVFDTAGLRTLGYVDQVVLPVSVAPKSANKPVRLKGRIELGICKDVCIPSEVSFDQQLDPSSGRNPSIAAALAQRPYSAQEAGVRSASCRLSPTSNGIQVEARITMPSAGGPELAVIEPGLPQLWASEAETERQGNTLVARSEMIHVSGSAFAVDRSRIRITVLGQNHSVDIQGCTSG